MMLLRCFSALLLNIAESFFFLLLNMDAFMTKSSHFFHNSCRLFQSVTITTRSRLESRQETRWWPNVNGTKHKQQKHAYSLLGKTWQAWQPRSRWKDPTLVNWEQRLIGCPFRCDSHQRRLHEIRARAWVKTLTTRGLTQSGKCSRMETRGNWTHLLWKIKSNWEHVSIDFWTFKRAKDPPTPTLRTCKNKSCVNYRLSQ